jgi:uncharacterized protein with NRDE domain
VCLLIVLSRTDPDHPLVVAANRDERLDRPAEPMAVLREGSPRILGGRDLLAGGTWLAVNEHGVVAGLTNSPALAGRDPTRRSRGELPLALASHGSAELAVGAFATAFSPGDYNPAWLLVGDRDALFFIDMTGSAPVIERLPAGLHILENRPPGEASAKVDNVRSLLAGAEDLSDAALRVRLRTVLANHHVPSTHHVPRTGSEKAAAPAGERPVSVLAACVHTESYGTRWSGIISVSSDTDVPPEVEYADGPPCVAPFVGPTPGWSRSTGESRR